MNDIPEKRVKPTLSTTDILALGRNHLANERTLLAYIRTCLSILVAGVSLIQFFDLKVFIILGYCLIPFGFVCLLIGINRFKKVQRDLKLFEDD